MFGKSIVAVLFLLHVVQCRPQNQNAAAGQQQAAGTGTAAGAQGQCGAHHPEGGDANMANNPMAQQMHNCFSLTPCAKRDQCRNVLEGIMTSQSTINQVKTQLPTVLNAAADQQALNCFLQALSDASSVPVKLLGCLANTLTGQQASSVSSFISTFNSQSGDELASKQCQDIAGLLQGLNAPQAIATCMQSQFNSQHAEQSGANSQMHAGGSGGAGGQPPNAQDHCAKMQSWIQSRIQCLHSQHQSAGQCTDNNTGAAANANPAPAAQSG